MDSVVFPKEFPTEDQMLDILKRTIEKSWRVDLSIEDIEAFMGRR